MLLACAVVGIIACLVLPALVTGNSQRALDLAFEREVKTISSAIDGLDVNENQTSFFSTMMYTDAEPESYSNSSGTFIKKYLRVSKYCGDSNGNCFADKYYEYKEGDKRVYTPEYKGACASLKNGVSICIMPQIGANNITGIIDLNGPKGPNVKDRDLRTFSIASKVRTGINTTTSEVIVADDVKIDTPDTKTECEKDSKSYGCCLEQGVTETNKSWCCTYEDIKKGNSACNKEIRFSLNCYFVKVNQCNDERRCTFTTDPVNPDVPIKLAYQDGMKDTSRDTGATIYCSYIFNGSGTLPCTYNLFDSDLPWVLDYDHAKLYINNTQIPLTDGLNGNTFSCNYNPNYFDFYLRDFPGYLKKCITLINNYVYKY